VKDFDDLVKIRSIMKEMAKIKEIIGQNVTKEFKRSRCRKVEMTHPNASIKEITCHS
jgi:hypothetical protein